MIYRFSVLAPVLVLTTLLASVLSIQTLNGGAGMEFVTPELPRAALGKGYEPAPLEVRVGGACPLVRFRRPRGQRMFGDDEAIHRRRQPRAGADRHARSFDLRCR